MAKLHSHLHKPEGMTDGFMEVDGAAWDGEKKGVHVVSDLCRTGVCSGRQLITH